ncbi:helix-turn-helix domain-containing protein [Leptospira noguchii]|uniref:helix-turn-helix domain-containing protein n=1 Tax=Leptospira noguchii TaxID=28182 RepID=UPI000AA8F406|nr:helix-turn-helix domain-containing protein [Leptospira noguchii]
MKRYSRRPSKLTLEQKKELKRIIIKGPTSNGYANELWSTYRVSEVIRKEFGVTFSSGLRRIFSYIS